MKNRVVQGNKKLYIALVVVIFALSLFMLSACNTVAVEKIEVDQDSVPTNVKISGFDITKVILKVYDEGSEAPRTVGATMNMLSAESRTALQTAGEKTLTIYYQKKSATFTTFLFDETAELVTVTFKNSAGETVGTAVTEKGGTVSSLPSVSGITGWVDKSGNDFTTSTKVNEDMEITGTSSSSAAEYTVTFLDYKDQQVQQVKVKSGNKLSGVPAYTQPASIATYNWYFGNDPLDINSLVITKNITITMRVTYVSYLVNFVYKKPDGTSETLASEQVVHGQNATKATEAANTLAAKGYNFTSWDKSFTNVTTQLTITANASIKTYTVTFLDYNNAAVAQRTVNHGASVTNIPTESTQKTGYNFTGWSVANLTSITQNTEVKALYAPKPVTITLHTQAGAKIPKQTAYGSVIFVKDVGTAGKTELKLYIRSSVDNTETVLDDEAGKMFVGLFTDGSFLSAYTLPYTVSLTSSNFYTKWLDPAKGSEGLLYNGTGDTVIGYTGTDKIVYIPDLNSGTKVTKIGNSAFGGSQLTGINFGANIAEIGENAFFNSKLSGKVVIPEGVKVIGNSAFELCGGIEEISFPATLTSLGESVLSQADGLKTVLFAQNSVLKEIPDFAFRFAEKLENIVLPESVITISDYAFSDCAVLASINLDNVLTVGAYAFYNCEKLSSAGSAAKITEIGYQAFSHSSITSLVLTDIETLEVCSFAFMYKLASVTLGKKLTALPDLAFWNCSGLTEVIFQEDDTDGLADVGEAVFSGCLSLRVLSLPSTLATVSAETFSGSYLTEIKVPEENQSFMTAGGVLFTKDCKTLISYPKALTAGLYEIPDGTEVIEENAFRDASAGTVIFPATLKEIVGDYTITSKVLTNLVFNGAVPTVSLLLNTWYIEAVYIYEANDIADFEQIFGLIVTVLGEEELPSSSFDAASGLYYTVANDVVTIIGAGIAAESITVPARIKGKYVTAIADGAFANNMLLKSVKVEAVLETLGEYAFYNCHNLSSVTFVSRVVNPININSFENTEWFDENEFIVVADTAVYFHSTAAAGDITVTVPSGVSILADDLFKGMSQITKINLPSSVTSIGSYAFAGTGISSINLPGDVTEIGAYAFENCANLTSVELKNTSITELSANVFSGCAALKMVTLPSFMAKIGESAFAGCVALEAIELPADLVQIGKKAFENCSSLKSLSLPVKVGAGLAAGVKAVGEDAFSGCSKLVSVRVWSENAYEIGSGAFPAGAYIYVSNSDGRAVYNKFVNAWTAYTAVIREVSQTPMFTFVVDKIRTATGTADIPALKNVSIPKQTLTVLVTPPQAPTAEGYIFAGWCTSLNASAVTFPYAVTADTTLYAKWLIADGGSLALDSAAVKKPEGYSLTSYNGTETKLFITASYAESVLFEIGAGAFSGKAISEIQFIGTGLLRICADAFRNMPNLKRIVLPEGVTFIGANAFANCSSLEYIYIPSSVTTIETGAFASCPNLIIEFGEQSVLTEATAASFAGSKWYYDLLSDAELTFITAGTLLIKFNAGTDIVVTVPTGVKAIAAGVFENITVIEVVELHSGIKYIGNNAFAGCTNLSVVDFGTATVNIEYIGADAFKGTRWLNDQNRMVYVGNVLKLYRCESEADENVVLPDFITVIDTAAFAYTSIKSITLSSKLKAINDGAFTGCIALEYITIPKTVTSVGANAFKNCTSLKTVYFETGSTLKMVGDYAFAGCTSLGSEAAAAELVLPASVMSIGKGAFEGASALTKVDLSLTQITTVADNTFKNASSLDTVKLSSKVLDFSAGAFENCALLANIVIPADTLFTSLGDRALAGTKFISRTPSETEEYILISIGSLLISAVIRQNLTAPANVTVPSNIKFIGEGAFKNAFIASVALPSGLAEIRSKAFENCGFLTGITIPNSASTIGDSAFSGCAILEEITLGEGLLSIGQSVFASCSGLKRIYVKRPAYTSLTLEQIDEIRDALDPSAPPDTFQNWLALNSEVFTGTTLGTGSVPLSNEGLRIYVLSDSQNFNLEFYKAKWGLAFIYKEGTLPTVSFDTKASLGATYLAPINTQLLTEANVSGVYFTGHTLYGWINKLTGLPVTFPLKVFTDITLEAVWIANERNVAGLVDSDLGFTYAILSGEAVIAGFSPSANIYGTTMIIPSSIRSSNVSYPLTGVSASAFTSTNVSAIKKVLFVRGGSFKAGEENPFRYMTNLESFVIDGTSAYLAVSDGVLYTSGLNTLVSYPAAKKSGAEAAVNYAISPYASKILSYAFSNTSLKSLTVPVSIRTVLNYAFVNNLLLDTIKFDAGSELTEVGATQSVNAFSGTKWHENMANNNVEFRIAGSYLLNYRGNGNNVSIPSGVFTIGHYAFSNNFNSVERLVIPASVGRINSDAFAGCSNIRDIVFTAGSLLSEIANDVFNATSWISSMNPDANEFVIAGNVLVKYRGSSSAVVVPSEAKIIGYRAFESKNFTSVELHNQVTRIDENAFFNCQSLTAVSFPASLVSIANGAFYECIALASVTFAENSKLESIGSKAFYKCNRITQIAFPNTLKTIGDNAFELTSALRTATFNSASQLTSLGSGAFVSSGIENVFIPSNLTEIKTSTFENCTALRTVTFADGNKKLSKIGLKAFKNCQNLGSSLAGKNDIITVSLPNNVTVIESEAFYGCSNMYGIWMGEMIQTIGAGAFNACNKLANVTISTPTPPYIASDSFMPDDGLNIKKWIFVNTSSDGSTITDYKNAWGGVITTAERIILRGTKFTVRIIDGAVGSEQVLWESTSYQFLSSDKLPALTHPSKGDSLSFFTNRSAPTTSIICTSANPYYVLTESVVNLYVNWTNG